MHENFYPFCYITNICIFCFLILCQVTLAHKQLKLNCIINIRFFGITFTCCILIDDCGKLVKYAAHYILNETYSN